MLKIQLTHPDGKLKELQVPDTCTLGRNMTTLWDGDVSDAALRQLFSGTTLYANALTPAGVTNKICNTVDPRGDLKCAKDKTTHGYWNKDENGTPAGSIGYSASEQLGFKNRNMFYWEVKRYSGTKNDPRAPDLKGLGPAVYGQNWFADDGKTQAELEFGDRVYVARPIENRHRMAFNLSIQATMVEIKKLFDEADGKMVRDVSLREVFMMDANELKARNIQYQQLFSKQEGN
jgi:hypothetical protein